MNTPSTSLSLRTSWLRAASAVAGMLLISSIVGAQPPGFGSHGEARFDGGPEMAAFGERMHGRFSSRLADVLELTDEQIAAWEAQQEATRAELEPLRDAMHSNRQALHELLDSEAPDPTAVGQTMLDGRALREEGKAIHEAAKADFESLLTPEQLERYETIQELRPDRRRGGRRGPGRRGGRGGAGNARFGGAPIN